MATAEDRITERLLVDAGIGPGMRVLDAGCGYGKVTALVARLVGAQGHVVGLDRHAAALETAGARAAELGLTNVTFVQGDLVAVPAEYGPFDAAVERRVLMYQPDAEAAIRGLAATVKPGGLVVVQEHDATLVPGRTRALPLHERVLGWVWETVKREGANPRIGFDLWALLTRAGLVVEEVRAEALVQTPTAHHPVEEILRAILPRIVQQGVATAAEIDVETLGARLRAERAAAEATYIGDMVFGAWARKVA